MAATLIPPEIDPQDPLPDSSFLWRRVFTYGAVAALLALAFCALYRLPVDGALEVVKAAFLLIFGLALLYMGGASVKEITALLATLKLRLHGPRDTPKTDPTPSAATVQAKEEEQLT